MRKSFGVDVLKDQRGFHVHIITPILVIFSMIGIWYVYDSYKKERLKENLSAVVADYKSAVVSVISDPKDKEKIDQLFQQVDQIAEKYKK